MTGARAIGALSSLASSEADSGVYASLALPPSIFLSLPLPLPLSLYLYVCLVPAPSALFPPPHPLRRILVCSLSRSLALERARALSLALALALVLALSLSRSHPFTMIQACMPGESNIQPYHIMLKTALCTSRVEVKKSPADMNTPLPRIPQRF